MKHIKDNLERSERTSIPSLGDQRQIFEPLKVRKSSKLSSVKELSDYKYELDESSIIAITDQKGTIAYQYLSIRIDITERKLAGEVIQKTCWKDKRK